jgi:enoyl-CoA hydratase/carnithine racemase
MISHAIANGIATIELTAAATRNALGLTGWRALSEAVAAIDTSAVRAVVVRSATDGMFCSGSDLREIIGLADDAAARAPFREIMRHALESLAGLPCRWLPKSTATVSARALRWLSRRICVWQARVRVRDHAGQARHHVSAGRRGSTGRAGRAGQARRLLYAAEVIDTAEAARIGLVEVQADDARPAHGLAHAMAVQSPASLAALKQAVRRSLGHDPALDAAFDGAFAGADFREGLLAFAKSGGRGLPIGAERSRLR